MPTPDTDPLDRADMQRLVAGDDSALDDLMRRHGAAVHRLLLGLVQDPEEANDLAQETFVRVYSARKRYRPADRFVPWLFTIATNLARNRLRWRARHPTVSLATLQPGEDPPWRLDPEAPADPCPAERLQTEERIRAVRRAVAELPPRLREVVVLCEWEELSHLEVATVLGTTPKAVESLLYRARRLLRERLQPWL